MDEASTKRFEDNVKFVFKLAFRKLKSTLLKRNRISFYSKKFDSQFYEYYFKDTAQRLNMNITEFFDSFDTKKKAKTLSVDYLKLVFNSPVFKEDFVSYINGEAIRVDYHTTLRRKIRHLLLKFDPFFVGEDKQSVKIGIEKIQNYFRKNRQCKLPWTNNEIITAINTFSYMVKMI